MLLHGRGTSSQVENAMRHSNSKAESCEADPACLACLTLRETRRFDARKDQALRRRSESNQFRTMHDAVLALVTDLLGSKSQDVDIDDRTNTLIREYLPRLQITAMRLTRNDLSGQTIVVSGLDCRKIVLASLTPSELMNSVADLAAHLLHMV